MFRQEYFFVFVKEAAPMPLFLKLLGKNRLAAYSYSSGSPTTRTGDALVSH
jgi:hypothetical protein